MVRSAGSPGNAEDPASDRLGKDIQSHRLDPSVSRFTSTVTERQHPLDPDQIDPATKFLYTPHTITGLIVGFAILLITSRTFNPPVPPLAVRDNREATVRHGLVAAALVYLGYSFLQGPATSMVRPHPGLWRIIHGIVTLYLLVLVFILFQNVNDARSYLQFLYPNLGVHLPERAYGSECRLVIPGKGINWEVIKATLFDEFVVAHTLGWWGKALILRNYLLLWILSVGFELCELTFQHMLPNFNECWWDSWILDVAVCNFGGLLAGMATVRWFDSLEYNWEGLSKQPNLVAKAKRSVWQFSPHSWDSFHWHIFSSPMRCLESLAPIIFILIAEVNAFFLKFILWVPPLNPLNTYRLVLLFAMALPAVREWYLFIESDNSDLFNKLGPSAWLACAVVLAETLVCVKFGRGMFPEPWPPRVLWAWGSFLAVFGTFMAVWSVRHYLLAPRASSKPKTA
ncbi:hypothetical protein WJX73_004520 [Symbiochloris irregularis]|uniref:CDP-diacylglycerol--serine O-phosphatidyltransferase n=1 Tax=Symbiochloris irregularis TaxID=706552 RepID=A0AAW1Q025_9CHLO